MELYKKYPKVTTILCFVEVFMYAGHLFGWSSLLFILKSEGFYSHLCAQDEALVINDIDTVYNYTSLIHSQSPPASNREIKPIDVVGISLHDVKNLTENTTNHRSNSTPQDGSMRGCHEQDTKLNLWFSVAIFAAYFACAFLGPLLQKTGVFVFRLMFMCLFTFGAMCLSLASPNLPWLICPGLCCVGISGMALYTTNIQTSFLFPAIQSTITSVFVGLYDASTIFTQLLKVAFELGISRKTSYIVFGIVYVILLGFNTVFFMPRVRLDPHRAARKVKEKNGDISKENELFLTNRTKASPDKSLCGTLLSAEYILHIYWMGVQGVRFVTFLGFLNSWLASRFDSDTQKESYYLSVFSYTTLGTAVSAVTAGLLHDCQRRKFIGSTDYKRKRLPIVLPLIITTLLSIITTALTFVAKETVLYFVFILFTIYRSYLFSFEVTFINDVFPLEYFSVLFGVLHSSAGLAGMLQFPLFKWDQAYAIAPQHVSTFFIVLEVSTLIHPFYIWLKCNKHEDKPNAHSLDIALHIEPTTR